MFKAGDKVVYCGRASRGDDPYDVSYNTVYALYDNGCGELVFKDDVDEENYAATCPEIHTFKLAEDVQKPTEASTANAVTLIRYNGKLYDKEAFEDAIKGLVVYSVEGI